jgi:hypothetical protein
VPISTATTTHNIFWPIVFNALGVAFLLFGAAGDPLVMFVFMMFGIKIEKIKRAEKTEEPKRFFNG